MLLCTALVSWVHMRTDPRVTDERADLRPSQPPRYSSPPARFTSSMTSPTGIIRCVTFLVFALPALLRRLTSRIEQYEHCPASSEFHDSGKCECDPSQSFDNDGYSCLPKWYRVGRNPDL